MNETLIAADGVKKYFPVMKGVVLRSVLGYVRAVDGISFAVSKGATFGLVGESGCGKTTVAKLLLRIERPTEGSMYFHQQNIHTLEGTGAKGYRKSVQPVFQDPFSSLSPRMQVWEIIGEPLIALGELSHKEINDRSGELLERVGLHPSMKSRYPHQFSGGQRQRIAIARALASNPEVLILDEPVSALDVSIRAQIMNLLRDLQDDFGITMIIIAHDLPVVRYMSQQIAVMYLGQIVETGPSEQVYDNPIHPYTKALLAAAPSIRADGKRSEVQLQFQGEVALTHEPAIRLPFPPQVPFCL